MAVATVTVVPLGTAGPSLSAYVRKVIAVAEAAAGVKVLVGPNGTTLAGELDAVFAAVRAMHEIPFAAGAQRVMTLINLDDRRDQALTIEGKLKAVRK
jgi:uncharacterized protein (TIGR00106 family)